MLRFEKGIMLLGVMAILIVSFIVYVVADISFYRGVITGFANGSFFVLDEINESIQLGYNMEEALERSSPLV